MTLPRFFVTFYVPHLQRRVLATPMSRLSTHVGYSQVFMPVEWLDSDLPLPYTSIARGQATFTKLLQSNALAAFLSTRLILDMIMRSHRGRNPSSRRRAESIWDAAEANAQVPAPLGSRPMATALPRQTSGMADTRR